MSAPSGDEGVVARLLAGGLAGPHRSHGRESNVANAGRLAAGDPEYTFGLPGVESANAEEALAAVASFTGAPPGEPYIDPAATIAAVRAAARRLAGAARAGATILIATGHPTGLLVHHGRLVRSVAGAGGRIARPLDGREAYREGAHRRMIEYFGGVAALSDGANVLHTHAPRAMEAMLAAGLPPDLVLADHGYAGAAVAAGIPTIAVMDTNDPALAVAAARGAALMVVPMDDNRAPDSYDVIAELFEEAFLGSGGVSR